MNGDFASKKRRVMCEVFPMHCFRTGTRDLLAKIEKPISSMNGIPQSISLSIPESTSNVQSVLQMKTCLKRYLSNDLYAAILHGSLGTGEVVNYSDFDALVIIKDEVFWDEKRLARVAQRLFQARKFMYKHDPLQHHGWFVVPECALQSWPESYLPVEALRNASHILSDVPQKIVINPVMDREKCKQHLVGLTIGIQSDISANQYGTSMYKFKGLMSKVLLLPTLYLQSLHGNGVFKRESFDLAKRKFAKENWAAVEAASIIRKAWPQVRPLLPNFLSKRPGFVGDIVRRRSRQKVPTNLLAYFGPNEKKALMQLIQKMTK